MIDDNNSQGMAGSTKIYDIRGMSEYSRLQDYTAYKATQVGNFSISVEGDFVSCDKSKLPTLKKFTLPLNLNVGYNPKKVMDTSNGQTSFPPWEKGLKWIEGSADGYQSLLDIDVITQCDVLTDIGYTNHDFYKNPWKFEACKFNGKLYIRKSEGAAEENLDTFGLKNYHWVKKFEELVIDRQLGTKATYQMLKGQIGSRNVLFSSQVAAVTSEGKHMEIQTCFANKLTAKLPQAWLQSHLGNVDILYYGMKDKRGFVTETPTEIVANKVPGIYVQAFQANAMIGFLGDVIDWLYTSLPDGDETWTMEYNAALREISLNHGGGGEFLPAWYVKLINGKKEDELAERVETLDLENS